MTQTAPATAIPTDTTPTDTTPDVTTPAPSGPEAAICDVCEHTVDSHGATDARYCAATSANALSRGCICASAV